jgi:uncharacterized coiled-coil DUF342 family protein
VEESVELSDLKGDVDALRDEMHEEFEKVRQETRQEFAQVREETRQEFARVREETRQEFAQVRKETRQEFAQVREETRQEFAQVRQEFEQVRQRFEEVDQRFTRMEQRIADEGTATRRHFDIVAEEMRGYVKLSLDQSSAVAVQLAALAAQNAAEHEGFVRLLDDLDHRVKSIE